MSPTSNQSPAAAHELSLWLSTPRRMRAANLGPAAGEHDFGQIVQPGLHFFLADHASGKTSVLRLLSKLQQGGKLATSATVTDGQVTAELELEPMRVSFTRTPGGLVREDVEGLAGLPRIDELPPSIELLISGGGRKDPEARARARIEALLSYSPVPYTEETFQALCRCLTGLSWSTEIDPTLAAAWEGLLDDAAKESNRLRREPLRTAAGVIEWISAHREHGKSLLGEQDLLVDLLNASGNAAEKALAVAKRRVSAVQGRMQETLTGAAAQFDRSADSTLREALEQPVDLAGAEALHVERATALRGVRLERAARISAEARQARIRATHGERPAVDEAEVAAARAAVAEAEAGVAALAGRVAAAEAAAEAADERAIVAVGRVESAWHALELFTAELRAKAFDAAGGPRFGQDIEPDAARAKRLVEAFAQAVGSDAAAKRREARAVVDAARTERAQADATVTRLRTDLTAAEARRDQARDLAAAWDAREVELSAPIEGPEQSEVDAAEAAEAQSGAALALARVAARYQATASELVSALDLVAKVEKAGRDYRRAATESWSHLGYILTGALKLPWLQIDGLDIYLGYAEGRLNNDPALIAEATAAAEQAAAMMDSLSPVALPRFVLERVRQAPAVTWRKIDDEVMVSTAELHSACLAVLLSRREQLGGIVLIPWQVLAALDEGLLRKFDADLREAGLLAFSERPRRLGDPEGLLLERVADWPGAAPVEEPPVDGEGDEP